MCTVTYIPAKNSCILTSNRDEKYGRKRAIEPLVYEINGKKLIYPRDGDAGGSWIALHENGNAAVLLNGAFNNHVSSPPYRQSRGTIFLQIIAAENPGRSFEQIDLDLIEPFTLVLLQEQGLLECRWDGSRKHRPPLNKEVPHLWSSATLYSNDLIEKRKAWFSEFLRSNQNPTQQDILNFHQLQGDGAQKPRLLMADGGPCTTISVTSIMLTKDRGSMKYLDLQANIHSERKIEFESSYELM